MSPTRRYQAPAWLPGGHAQTIYPALCLGGTPPAYQRERWETPDGDFIELDWLPAQSTAPLFILFHGLEGSSRSHYARAVMANVAARGWNGVVVHFRGCGGSPNRAPRAYHSGDHEEYDWILRRFAQRHPAQARFVAGISLGGNALLKWLARAGPQAHTVVSAAASVSAPIDLIAAGDGLAHGFNRLYTAMFLRTLKRKSLAKLERFPGLFAAQAVHRARTLRAFDDIVTGPLHGFRDAQDYWTRASTHQELALIKLPTLLVHARNDPFLPGRYLPASDELPFNIEAEFPAEGGHVGFVQGAFPGNLDWLPNRLLDFMRQWSR